MSRTFRPRPVTLLATAAGLLTLGACAPIVTLDPYSPSDGIRVDLSDDVRGVNLLVVAAHEGGTGVVQGALANRTADTVTFTLTADGAAPVRIEVGPTSTVLLGTDDGEEILLESIAGAPGTFLDATLEADGLSQTFYLPVLDGTLAEYADAVPQD